MEGPVKSPEPVMSRKKIGFQWAREDQEEEDDGLPVSERTYDHEHQAARKKFQDLAARLVGLSPGSRALLPLDETVHEAIEVYLRQGPKSSRRRQLLRVQTLLRGVDVEALEVALDADLQGGAESPKAWRERLVAGDDAELMGFCEAHPGADRQQLRSLLRAARKQNPAGERARARLLAALEGLSAL